MNSKFDYYFNFISHYQGRLVVSNVDGRNAQTGKHTALYAYGGRSFSIWDLDTMELVYDSGSDIEDKIAKHHKEIFNADPEGPDAIPDTFDKRSDNKVRIGWNTLHQNHQTLLLINALLFS